MTSDESKRGLMARAEPQLPVRSASSSVFTARIPLACTLACPFSSSVPLTLRICASPSQIRDSTTTDMNIRFLAPCLTDLRAEARVIKCGRTLCPVAVELFDANDKAVAVAQVTYLRLEKTPSP